MNADQAAQRTAANHEAVYEWIAAHTPQGARVLDIGCGEGDLLSLLADKRGASGTGIELSEPLVMKAILRGLSVHHGNVEEGLDHFGDRSFDLVVLSLTIQELGDPLRVLREALRVGRRAVIVFPNFAHWRARVQLALAGRAPDIPSLPYTWYESPNRHYLSALDWEDFVRQEDWHIAARGFISGGETVRFLPNLLAEVAMYLVEPAPVPA